MTRKFNRVAWWARAKPTTPDPKKSPQNYYLDTKPAPDKGLRAIARGDSLFLAACAAAGVEPTRRQASKFLQRRGRAYSVRHQPRPIEVSER